MTSTKITLWYWPKPSRPWSPWSLFPFSIFLIISISWSICSKIFSQIPSILKKSLATLCLIWQHIFSNWNHAQKFSMALALAWPLHTDNTQTHELFHICMYVMFIAALFTKAKWWKQSKCPSTHECTNKMWYISIQWNIIQPKRNEAMKWTYYNMDDLEKTFQIKRNQTEKATYISNI